MHERYCSQGHLDCIKVDTGQNEKYLIRPESIDRRIQELQQIAKSRHVPTRRDESGRDSSPHDTDELGNDDSRKQRQKIEALEAELLDLQIANRAKGQFIEQLKSERAIFLDEIAKQSRQIGQLETRLALQAGTPSNKLAETSSRALDAPAIDARQAPHPSETSTTADRLPSSGHPLDHPVKRRDPLPAR